MINIKQLIIKARDVETNEEVIGYICSCPDCRKPLDSFMGDRTRPQAMITGYDGTYGNVKVFADTISFVNPL